MIVEFTAGVIGPQIPKHLEKKEEDKSIFPKETWQEKMSKMKISFPIESFIKLSYVSDLIIINKISKFLVQIKIAALS